MIDNTPVINKIKKLLKTDYDSQKELAGCLGISASYLNDIIQGKRNVPHKVGCLLGFKKVEKWVKR